MSIRLKGGRGPSLVPPSLSRINGGIGYDFVKTYVSGGSASTQSVKDSNRLVYDGAVWFRDGQIIAEGVGAVTLQNLNPEIGTLDFEGRVTRVTEGIMRVIVRSAVGVFKLEIDLRNKSDSTESSVFLSTLNGTLNSHLTDSAEAKIASINGTPSMAVNGKVYTTQNHTSKVYTRNPDLWISQSGAVDLTSISPWNSSGGVTKAGVLISRRHLANSAHFDYGIGTIVRLVNMAGVAFDYTVVGKARHPDYKPYYPDLTVYTLDRDVDASLTPCLVIPANYESFIDVDWTMYTLPASLGLDQEEKALIATFFQGALFIRPSSANQLTFYEAKIGGDSGNPAFLIVNGKLVLVTCWTQGGVGSGTPIYRFISDINTIMIPSADAQAGVSTGYTVTEADFSAWPNLTTQNYLLGDDGLGNKSAWVNTGTTENSKPVYHKLEAAGKGWKLSSNGSVWATSDLGSPDTGHPAQTSAGNEATPDLATFGTWSFTTP